MERSHPLIHHLSEYSRKSSLVSILWPFPFNQDLASPSPLLLPATSRTLPRSTSVSIMETGVPITPDSCVIKKNRARWPRQPTMSAEHDHGTHHDVHAQGAWALLVFCNDTNKIRKRTDTAVAFTQEYSRVSYPLRNMSTLWVQDHPRTHTSVWRRQKRALSISRI